MGRRERRGVGKQYPQERKSCWTLEVEANIRRWIHCENSNREKAQMAYGNDKIKPQIDGDTNLGLDYPDRCACDSHWLQ